MSNRSMARFLAAFAGMALAGAAAADFSSTVTIEARDPSGALMGAPFQMNIPLSAWATIDGSPIDWSNPYQDRFFQWGVVGTIAGNVAENPEAAMIGGASVHGLRMEFREDPQVVANFNVAAGPVNTTFTVTSISVGFPAIDISEAVGVASAAISVTDSLVFGIPGQISLLGLQTGGNAYSAFFNLGTGEFANLIPGTGGLINVPQGSTTPLVGTSGGFPAYIPVGASVTEIQSQFQFTLSAGDRAAGTSTFEVIPSPSAVGLLGLGALAAFRRRRA